MAFFHWLQENWFDLLQTTAIVATFATLRNDKKKEKVQNRIYFTERHAELLRRQTYDTKLWRIQRSDADLVKSPLTGYEETHVRNVLNNFSATYYAAKNGVFVQPSALPDDIRTYFALPIPREVWLKVKNFHDPDFVSFVEG